MYKTINYLRRNRASFKLPLLAVAFLFLHTALLCAEDYGDAYISASISDAKTLVPILAADTVSAGVVGMIFNGLVKYDKDLNLTGDLAESWEVKDGGLVIIFHLRKDVSWHDHQPFTAADVEFTYRKLIDPDVKTPYGGDFELVKSFEVIDKYTIRVTYKEPLSPALSSWGMPVMPRHLLETEDLNTTDFGRSPVGTGPYKFKSWKAQQKIELIANPDYFEHRPYIDRYIYRVIPDESTIFLELQTKGVDSSGLSALQYSRQTDTPFFKRNYRKFTMPSFSYIYLGYNLDDKKFSDLRVREALNHAVDKEEIIDMVLLGFGKVSTGPFIPRSWAYNQELKPVGFDPQRASALLKEAGWIDSDGDGWLDKDGERFKFTLATNQGNEDRLKTAQIIQKRLKNIGIEVDIKVVEGSVFIGEYLHRRNFEAILFGWQLALDPDSYDIWHSSKTGEGEFNFVNYQNPEVDRLLIEARRTFDQQKRKSYYHQIQEIIYREQPYMFLYFPESLSILSSRFEGVKPAPIGISYNFIDWWVPKAKQMYRSLVND